MHSSRLVKRLGRAGCHDQAGAKHQTECGRRAVVPPSIHSGCAGRVGLTCVLGSGAKRLHCVAAQPDCGPNRTGGWVATCSPALVLAHQYANPNEGSRANVVSEGPVRAVLTHLVLMSARKQVYPNTPNRVARSGGCLKVVQGRGCAAWATLGSALGPGELQSPRSLTTPRSGERGAPTH